MTQSNYNSGLTDSIADLEVRARVLQSRVQKGGYSDSEEAAEAIQDMRSSLLEKAEAFEGEPDAEALAEKYRKAYVFDPANALLYVKEMIADIADLYKKAFMLMLENMKVAHKERENVAYFKNVAHERDLKARKDERERKKKEHITQSREKQRAGKGKTYASNAPKTKETSSVRFANPNAYSFGSSRLVYVKTSEQKEKEARLARQRAREQSEMQASGASSKGSSERQMSKQSSLNPPAMSR